MYIGCPALNHPKAVPSAANRYRMTTATKTGKEFQILIFTTNAKKDERYILALSEMMRVNLWLHLQIQKYNDNPFA